MKRFNSISTKMIVLLIFTSIMTLVINIIMFVNINQALGQIEQVYATNVQLNEMEEDLDKIQEQLLSYLRTKNSNELQAYYISEQNINQKLVSLRTKEAEGETGILKNNIYYLGKNYFKITEEAITAKRGRNVDAYDEKYGQAAKIKVYLGDYMNQLNNNQFQKNSDNYLLLQQFLRYMQAIGTVMFFLVVICDTIMVIMLTRRLTNPLKVLAGRAKQVTNGDLSVQIPIFQTGDEVESLSKAFDKMMESIRSYIEAQRISMEKETELRENELKTQTLLKDAQLKYLQSQINPHFLFNTLNAGMQLATIEDAEKTAVFIENMAEFFRYNLSKINEDATLYDEIQLVDRYIYILNVRFAGDIHYQKEVEEGIGDVIVPSMILQPLVENAVQYGIRDVEWEGVITLLVYRKDGFVYMEVKDNGKGMEQSLITRILDGENVRNQKNRKSNGIGIYNVRERLMMYYNREDVLFIESEGENKGTKFIVKIPYEEG